MKKKELILPILAIVILVLTCTGICLSIYIYSNNQHQIDEGNLNLSLYSNITLDIADNVIELDTTTTPSQSLILNVKGTSISIEELPYTFSFNVQDANNITADDIMFSIEENKELKLDFEEVKQNGKQLSKYLNKPFYNGTFIKSAPINDVKSYKLTIWITDERISKNESGKISFKIKLGA